MDLGYYGVRIMSGQYASYWNAFLCAILCLDRHKIFGQCVVLFQYYDTREEYQFDRF